MSYANKLNCFRLLKKLSCQLLCKQSKFADWFDAAAVCVPALSATVTVEVDRLLELLFSRKDASENYINFIGSVRDCFWCFVRETQQKALSYVYFFRTFTTIKVPFFDIISITGFIKENIHIKN